MSAPYAPTIADMMRGNSRRVRVFRFHDEAPEWCNMVQACWRMGMRNRADVPDNIRRYMFRKEDRLVDLGCRSARYRERF